MRLGRESIKNFDSCCLCLQPVIEPMSCHKGHIFCKECIYQNLLTQKQHIARDLKLYEKAQENKKKNEERTKELLKQAELEAFNRLECGVLTEGQTIFRAQHSLKSSDEVEWEKLTETQRALLLANEGRRDFKGVKGKVLGGMAAAVDGVVARDVDNKANQTSNFWIPTNTPEAAPKEVTKPSNETMCPEGCHTLKLKQLVPLNFSKLRNVDRVDPLYVQNCRYQCAACMKTLTNTGFNSFFKGCGHVMCSPCVEKACLPDGRCFVCNAKVDRRDVVQMQAGGTGYAGHDQEKLLTVRVLPKAIV